MLIILVDILERLLKYLRLFISDKDKCAAPTSPEQASTPQTSPDLSQPPDQAIPQPPPTEPPPQAPRFNLATTNRSLMADLASPVSASFDQPDAAQRRQALADALVRMRGDPRNTNTKEFGRKKRGKIFLLDGDTVIYNNLFFTEVIWLQMRHDFGESFLFSWKRDR